MHLFTATLTSTPAIFHYTHTLAPAVTEWWIIIIAFLSALSESVPIVGIMVPGQTLVIGAGFLAKAGLCNPLILFILAALGAIVGDWIGYAIGRRYGNAFLQRFARFVFISQDNLAWTASLLRNHTGKALVFGRLNSLTRALVPFVAGSSQVPLRTFFVYNIFGGTLWAGLYVALGYFFGHSYDVLSRTLGEVAFWLIVLCIGVVVLWKKYCPAPHTATHQQSQEC